MVSLHGFRSKGLGNKVKEIQNRKEVMASEQFMSEASTRVVAEATRIAAVEYNYQEVDRKLKEQFIHSLNDKHMLEEIIKELMAAKNDDHITSGGVLLWTKMVEVQRTQVVILNTLTES